MRSFLGFFLIIIVYLSYLLGAMLVFVVVYLPNERITSSLLISLIPAFLLILFFKIVEVTKQIRQKSMSKYNKDPIKHFIPFLLFIFTTGILRIGPGSIISGIILVFVMQLGDIVSESEKIKHFKPRRKN